MRQWTRQVGYPVLTVPDDLAKPVAQQRFLTSGEQGEGHWLLPLSALVGDDLRRVDLGMVGTDADYARVSAWLREHQGQLVKLNAGQTGFFRVNYNASLWAAILRNWLRLPLVDRLGVLADGRRPRSDEGEPHCGLTLTERRRVTVADGNIAFALAKAGQMPLARLLDLLVANRDDRTLVAWQEIALHLDGYCRLFANAPWFPLLQRLVVELFAPVHQWVVDAARGAGTETESTLAVR